LWPVCSSAARRLPRRAPVTALRAGEGGTARAASSSGVGRSGRAWIRRQRALGLAAFSGHLLSRLAVHARR
jgi:hypothetical protein